jgi:hypothetical protein
MLQQKYRSSLTVQALGLLLRYGIARFGLPGAITVVIVINFILRLMLAARFTRVVLVVCFAVFGVLYLGAIFLLGMATTDEREKVRHGVARLSSTYTLDVLQTRCRETSVTPQRLY